MARVNHTFLHKRLSIINIFCFALGAAIIGASMHFQSSGSILGVSTSKMYRESNIYLGNGTNTSLEWTDVTGAESYVATTGYGTIISVLFDATLFVPTGNQKVWVRLYNVTDKHPVWNSELSMEGNGPTLLTTKSLTLDAGNKLYRVQMKSQLGFNAYLSSSRLRITSN